MHVPYTTYGLHSTMSIPIESQPNCCRACTSCPVLAPTHNELAFGVRLISF